MSNNQEFRLDDFELYKIAGEFRKQIYKKIKRLPEEEKYALSPQMRRAAISVSNNIAEGHGRWNYQENIQFCRISRGSVEEVIDDLNICIDENYFPGFELEELKAEAYKLIERINGYIAYLRKQKERAKNQ
ncbi:MAG: four helix bundle protein [Candidatus Aminicenantes bacterium]|nr:four helix bundle protein [Candidatus Aminicenantes bacterium]